MQNPSFGSDPTSPPHTTFVQADPSNFRAIVQRLTGASDDPSSPPKLPLTLPSSSRVGPMAKLLPNTSSSSSSAAAAALALAPPEIVVPRKPPGFKLHERRHRKLEQIQLSNTNTDRFIMSCYARGLSSPSSSAAAAHRQLTPSPGSFPSPSHFLGGQMAVMVSPVSPLDLFATSRRSSQSSPSSLLISPSASEQEERAIAEKGFYLHPSPLSTPRGSEPELLPLFPLQSPRHDHDHHRP